MKKLIIAFTLFLPFAGMANNLQIQPTYSVETTHRQFPEPAKRITRTYLGLAATYGTHALSTEFEVAQSTYSENTEGIDTTSTIRRAMLGLRSYPLTSKYLGGYVRGGISARQEVLDINDNGDKREEKLPVYLDPYAGAGLTLAVANNIAINAGATMIYNRGAESSDKYDVQYTLSGTFRVGNR